MLILSPDFLSQIDCYNPKFDESLVKYNTWKIGGPAKVLIETTNSLDLENLVLLCQKFGVPFVVLGNGSNVLISDSGLDCVVIVNKSRNLEILEGPSIGSFETVEISTAPQIESRHGVADSTLYTFEDLKFEEKGETVLVKIDSGVMLSFAINWSLKNSLSGLQWFSGIPGTVGGSLYNNIHGGDKHFSDYFVSATILEKGVKKEVGAGFFDFGYDQSVLRGRDDIIILSVTLGLIRVDEEVCQKAKFVATEWLKRKAVQPKISCGSVFQSIAKADQLRLGYPTQAIGYITDHVLGLKGYRVGNTIISPKHANFIENLGNAKSSEVLEIMKKITSQAKAKTGLDIYPEINFLGFEDEELDGLNLG